MQYDRDQWFSGSTDVIKPTGAGTWGLATGVVIRDYLSFINSGHQAGTNIEGFVNASLDGLRAVEFMHEYEPPADLGWDFATVYPNPSALSLTSLRRIGVWARSAGDVQDAPAASTALTSIPFAVLPPP